MGFTKYSRDLLRFFKVGDDDWYEVPNPREGIVHSKNSDRPMKKFTTLLAAGSTLKSNEEIDEFNENWQRNNSNYSMMSNNCQKYVFDLINFLTPANNMMGLPMTQTNVWANGPCFYKISAQGTVPPPQNLGLCRAENFPKKSARAETGRKNYGPGQKGPNFFGVHKPKRA